MERTIPDAPWYHRWFGTDYLEIYKRRSVEEAARTVEWLAQEAQIRPPALVLDLACGYGRHSAQLARRGYRTYGLDLSWPLLKAGTDDALAAPFYRLRGDMRRLPFQSGAFDLALSLFTSFGYFASREEDLRVLMDVKRVLKPEGRFVLDFLNAQRVKDEIIPQEESNWQGNKVIIQRRVDPQKNRVEKKISFFDANGRERQYLESVALYGQEDLLNLFKQAGLVPQRAFGNYDGSPFSRQTPRLIIIGAKSA